MTASTDVVASGQVRELVPGSRGDDHLARVRVVERPPRSLEAAGIAEETLIARRGPAPRAGSKAQLVAFAPDDSLGAFQEERGLHCRLVVQALDEVARFEVALGKPVEHPCAVRCRHHEARDVGERRLQPDVAVHAGLTVVGAQHDGIALQELLRSAGGVK